MIAEGNLEFSGYVLYVHAVVEQKGFAYLLLVAMQSIATFPISLLASVHLHLSTVIALVAIFNFSLSLLDYPIIIIIILLL
jgi:hypothetical protein